MYASSHSDTQDPGMEEAKHIVGARFTDSFFLCVFNHYCPLFQLSVCIFLYVVFISL